MDTQLVDQAAVHSLSHGFCAAHDDDIQPVCSAMRLADCLGDATANKREPGAKPNGGRRSCASPRTPAAWLRAFAP